MGEGKCVGVEGEDPAGGGVETMLQAWAKPLPGAVAVLLINPDAKPHDISVPLGVLPLAGSGKNLSTTPFETRDIWAHSDLGLHGRVTGREAAGGGNLTVTVGAYDSAFLRLEPRQPQSPISHEN